MKKETTTLNKSNSVEHGGAGYIAEIMNRIDKESQKAMLERLSETNPTLSDEIKKLMFVFNDIVNLNDMEIQSFIRVVDTKDLTISLKAANPEVQARIFSNMSSRQRDTIQSDMQYLRNLRVRDVEAAQQRIIEAIRGLEESGDIVLFKGGGDEIIA
jgi:flagellar motor switch protein FliG